MKKKQICSLFLCIAMMFSYFTQVMAYDIDFAHDEGFIKASVTSEDDLPLLSLEYMTSEDGKTFTKATSKPEVGPDITTATSDKDFYVGVKANKFSNFQIMSRGIYNVGLGLSYNTDYVMPEPDSYAANPFTGGSYNASTFSANVTTRLGFTGSPWVVSSTQIADSAGSSAAIDDAVGRVYVQLVLNTIGLYAPPVELDEEYLMFFKFRLKAVPPAGTKLFNFGAVEFNNITDLVFTFCGEDKTSGNQGSTTNLTYNNETSRLHEYLRLDTTDVDDMFPPEYTVTYDAGAGAFAGGATPTETVTKNDKLTFTDTATSADINAMANAAAPSGYVFNGWTTELDATDNHNPATGAVAVDNTTDINPTNVPTIDQTNNTLTLYATYTEGYSVTFHADPGSFSDSTNSKNIMKKKGEVFLNAGETISGTLGVDDPTLANHAFVDWYLKDGDTFTTLIDENALIGMGAIDKNLDVYPMWNQTVGDLTLTFDNNAPTTPINTLDTSVNPTSIKYSSNSTDTLTSVIGGMPVEPTRNDNYRFIGWYTNPNGDGERLKEDTVLSTYTSNGTITTVYARWGYVDPAATMVPENPQPTADTITVHFVEEGGKYSAADLGGTYKYTTINDKYIKPGNAIEQLPDSNDITPPDGKSLAGWATEITSEGKLAPGAVMADTTTAIETLSSDNPVNLYAVWDDMVTITFHNNDGSSPEVTTALQTKPGTPLLATGETLASKGVPNPPVNGQHKFLGWFKKDNNGAFTNDEANDSTMANNQTANADYYAKWDLSDTEKTDASARTIVFNKNHADAVDGAPTSLPYKEGETLQQSYGGMPTPPTRTGYKFLGWYRDASGDLTPALTVTEPLTDAFTGCDNNNTTFNVYAKWESDDPDNAVRVQFDERGIPFVAGITDIADKLVNFNDTIGSMPDASLDIPAGKSFGGWWTINGSSAADETDDTFWGQRIEGTTPLDGSILIGGTTALTAGATLPLYARLRSDLTITFKNTKTDATPVAEFTVPYNKTLTDIGQTVMPTPAAKTGYTFVGWYSEDATGKPDKLYDLNTSIDKTVTVYPKWSMDITIDAPQDPYPYTGSGQSPYADPDDVTITNDADNTDVKKEFGVDGSGNANLSKLIIEYALDSGSLDYDTDPSPYLGTLPVNVGNYDIHIKYDNTADPFIELGKITYVSDMSIIAATIDVDITDYIQYVDAGAAAQPVGVTANGTAPSDITIDPFATTSDIRIRFKNDADATDTGVTTMPTAYGTYTMSLELDDPASTKYAAGTIVTPADNKFYYYPKTRDVELYFGSDATVSVPVKPYTVATMKWDDTSITDKTPDNVAVYLRDCAAKTDLPVEKTDYTPPSGKRIAKWVISEDGTYDPAVDAVTPYTVFNKDTTKIIPSGDPLKLVAVYEDAEWIINFIDNLATPNIKTSYTVDANKAIADTDAVKKVAVNDVEVSPAPSPMPSDVPASAGAAPTNKKFYGWYTGTGISKYIDGTDYKATDITNAVTNGEIEEVTDAFKPADGIMSVDAYAVYILSDEAKINTISFKENSAAGDPMDNYAENPADAIANSRPEWIKDTNIVFDPDTNEYWLIAENDVKELYADITLDPPATTASATISTTGSAVTLTRGATAGTYTLQTSSATGDGLEPTQYNSTSGTNSTNDIVITVTAPDGIATQDYTFHVIRYAEARFELNYGNSPFGLIMNMPDWDAAHKQAAKDDFISGSSVTKNTFKTAMYTPTGLVAGEGLKYTTVAWDINEAADNEDVEKNKVNMDRNDYAIFVYQRTDFRDPGFKAINSLDREVDPTTSEADATQYAPVVTRDISFRRLAGDGQNIEVAADDDETVTIKGQPSEYLFTEITSKKTAANGAYMYRPVRPDKYTMTYTFVDPYITDITKNTIAAERPVIVLSILGDANFDMSINAGDLSLVNAAERAGDITVSKTAMPTSAWNMFVYRVLDNTSDGSVNAGDASMINTAERTMTNPDTRYYPFLPQN